MQQANVKLVHTKSPEFIYGAPDTKLVGTWAIFPNHYTAPDQAYSVIERDGRFYKVDLGAGKYGYLLADRCIVLPSNSKSTRAVVTFFLKVPSGFQRTTYESAPVDQIPVTAADYRLLRDWIGEIADEPATLVGLVQSSVQTGSGTTAIQQSNGTFDVQSRRQATVNTTAVTLSNTTNYYQLIVEDSAGSRKTVNIQRATTIIPQTGDYLAVWANVQNGVYYLVQGVRRDTHDLSSYSVLVPQEPTKSGDGCSTIAIYPLVTAALVMVIALSRRYLQRGHISC